MELALAVRPKHESADPVETALESVPSDTPSLPASKQVSVREVARLAQVSATTVSLVINDNPRISQGTQRRVRKAMEQLGYRPNRLAQNLSRRCTQMLAVMLPSLPGLPPILASSARACSACTGVPSRTNTVRAACSSRRASLRRRCSWRRIEPRCGLGLEQARLRRERTEARRIRKFEYEQT